MIRTIFAVTLTVLFLISVASAADTTRGRISAALDSETGLGKYEIDIEGRAGLVTLTGEVASAEAKSRIGEIATRVAKGDEVRNLLTINEAFASAANKSSALEHGVSQALADLRSTTVFKVSASIRGETVTLNGDAATPEELARIVNAIQSVPGVKSVTNNLIVVAR